MRSDSTPLFVRRPPQQELRQICYVGSRGRQRVVPQVSEVAAPPLAATVVDRACAAAPDRARAVSLSLLQLARLAQGRRARREASSGTLTERSPNPSSRSSSQTTAKETGRDRPGTPEGR